MMDILTTSQNPQDALNQSSSAAQKPRKVLHMVENERMGGKVPVWRTAETPEEQIQQRLRAAQSGETISFENTLAYTGTQIHEPSIHQQEFGFGDLVDMVNPLHHIPVVGHVYREITGDEIKPIGNIIGGAVFGGPVGAANGLINTVIEEETGKDITGNALALALNGEAPKLVNSNAHPQKRLDNVTKNLETASSVSINDLPGNLLSFTDLGAQDSDIRIERKRRENISDSALPPREPITQVRLSGLYALAER